MIHYVERDQLFLHWVKSNETKPEEVFAYPLDKLLWARFPLKKTAWTLHAATLKSSVPSTATAVGMKFHQEVLVHSDKITDDKPVLLLSKEKDSLHITYALGTDPLFTASHADLEKTIAYLKRVGRWFGVTKVFRLDSKFSEPHPSSLWLQPPATWTSRLQNQWKNNREKVLAPMALLFVAMGFGLDTVTANNQEEIRQAKRMWAQQRVQEKQRHRQQIPSISPETLVNAILDGIPQHIYLTDIHLHTTKKKILVRGRTRSYDHISKMKEHLSKYKDIRRIQNEKATANTAHGRTWIDFSMEATLS